MFEKGVNTIGVILFLLIGAVCIMHGGILATIIVYINIIINVCVLPIIAIQIIAPKAVGIKIGIVMNIAGQYTINTKAYDEFVRVYEERLSTLQFWVIIIVFVSWMALFILNGYTKLSVLVLVVSLCGEIGKYRIYKKIKDNKTIWSAASYIIEMKKAFGNITK